jgi:hypothetical protein
MTVEHDPKCCVVVDGVRCWNDSKFWVGRNGVDDYTYCCHEHLQ